MAKRGRPRDGEGQLGREDWERAALAAIEEGGLAAAAVEPLARTLGVTKGSFYWHFTNRDALLTAALARWERQHTENVIAALAEIEDPRSRLEWLIARASLSEGAPRFHTALAEGASHPIVRPLLARVTARRIESLVACFRELGLAPAVARRRALLAYTAYLGLMHLHREAPGEMPRGKERAEYVKHVIASLLTT